MLKALRFVVDNDVGSQFARKLYIARRDRRQHAGAFGFRKLDGEMTNPPDPPWIPTALPLGDHA
jgi:hypothetical protein